MPELPIADEPHIAHWQGYLEQAGDEAVWPVLQQHLVQLRFPVRAGISNSEDYRAATRKGRWPTQADAQARLQQPGGLELYLHATPAGRIPVIEVENRADFVWLVQALTARNEPEPVPDSMGACIVAGFNNWDRIHAHRRAWNAENPMLNTDATWPAEFKRLTADKSAYQDRFVILSRGPYSNIAAEALDMTEQDWLQRSLVLRRDHECTHYFTARALGSMRNNLLDELIADFVGIVGAMGHYDAALALRAFGLEEPDHYRSGGRLENYRGEPRLDDDAFTVVTRLARRCIMNLERFDRQVQPRDPVALGHFVIAMTFLTLEEIAAETMLETSLRILEQVQEQSSGPH